LIAQTFQAMDQIAREMVFVEFVEVKIAQIVVGNLLGNVIDRDQDLVGDRHHSPPVPAPRLETEKLVSQIGAFGSGSRVGGRARTYSNPQDKWPEYSHEGTLDSPHS
jgi:hypothetical protein